MQKDSSNSIRRACAADAGAIAALHIASWQAVYRQELPAAFLDSQSLADHTERWHERLTSASTHVLVLEDDGAIVGFAASGPTRDRDDAEGGVWELYNLHIEPDRRGHRLGSRLFDATAALARRSGRDFLSLWVVESNEQARRFYERHGMQADGATQVHTMGDHAALHEVRYRISLE